MYLIGLTGGIASGKSVVSRRLGERGAVVVDADLLAREVVEPGTPALTQIADTFGPAVISDDGSLNRPELGSIIFSDADKRGELNAITHPAIWRRARELFDSATSTDPDAVVVYDVPLLAEAAADRPMRFDLIVVVDADADTRVERLVTLRGMTREDATRRIMSQAPDAERRAMADVLIDSNGTLERTLEQADALWERVSARA
ncbi:dephospho-CoA kinase [Glaciihabitans sp. dw_435]|uniref:dephospho-CoA kinase n=1 Tax=Glaciihabitans sp. dw_435 TaxID=2720081 RepID=UPI001BD4118A|nr:dephospho-CoA kinase [Glaciihabitans sp. dw_435]